MFSNARDHLDGPPLALPRVLDRLSERWWGARPRSRALVASAVVVLVVVAGAARVAASPHGPPTSAWIAARDLGVGHVLGTDDLRRVDWPSQLLPDGALTRPHGTLVAPLPLGAVATDRHLGDAGIAAGLPAGVAAVPIPVDALPELPAGGRVDLVAADHDGTGHLLASRAIVLHTDGVAVWLAVDEASATSVAAAALRGSIGVVLVPP